LKDTKIMKKYLWIFLVCSWLPLSAMADNPWPVLKTYDQDHLAKIALPIGGIGTGTISLGGRGNLFDWEIMNHPDKGFTPTAKSASPFFALYCKSEGKAPVTRALEGPLDVSLFEESHGSATQNHGLPRFRQASFTSAYPLGQVHLADPDIPLSIRLDAFNPMIPGDPDQSGIPIVILRFVLENPTNHNVEAAICGSMPNFIGMDGWQKGTDWKGDTVYQGGKDNRNAFHSEKNITGIYMTSNGVENHVPQFGTMALVTTAKDNITYRTNWRSGGWGTDLLDFWDDFSADGQLQERDQLDNVPQASLAVFTTVPANQSREITFLITWHFPNRYNWQQSQQTYKAEDAIGNYYTEQWDDAWHVARDIAPQVARLEEETVGFVSAFCHSDIPDVVKEAALFNASTLRTQTSFRTRDGRFYGWEGSCNSRGCCFGSCTHVWNYEQATAFLYGSLALSMREVEFAHATTDEGLMCFRVQLPIERGATWKNAAADGQMGCIMKMYRDWQLSGDDQMLKQLWPKVRKALEFCWIKGGWDADQDGVMDGCQHNTMDVEYYGPNPQMGIWYLGALRASEEMARHLGETDFADTCHRLFTSGSQWIDQHLFNGEYYIHEVRPPGSRDEIAPSLIVGMGAADPTKPEYQLAEGCLVDQLVGQFMAHVCGLGYLTKPDNVKKTLQSIMKYNYCEPMQTHFNNMRSFAMGDEAALLMASYPKKRPEKPFSYFNEVMTGFEYTAAIGMLYEGLNDMGLQCIQNVRNRYDGKKRSPYNEAECGHHYARAMASWASILALTEFHYSGVERAFTITANDGTYFWSNGYAYGTCAIQSDGHKKSVTITALGGDLKLKSLRLQKFGSMHLDVTRHIVSGNPMTFTVSKQ
jgi:non-lysosomal glucosylceramidase